MSQPQQYHDSRSYQQQFNNSSNGPTTTTRQVGPTVTTTTTMPLSNSPTTPTRNRQSTSPRTDSPSTPTHTQLYPTRAAQVDISPAGQPSTARRDLDPATRYTPQGVFTGAPLTEHRMPAQNRPAAVPTAITADALAEEPVLTAHTPLHEPVMNPVAQAVVQAVGATRGAGRNPDVYVDRHMSVNYRPAATTAPRTAGAAHPATWNQQARANPAPTPGVDDTPYIQFAVDQLTRDEEIAGRGRDTVHGEPLAGTSATLADARGEQIRDGGGRTVAPAGVRDERGLTPAEAMARRREREAGAPTGYVTPATGQVHDGAFSAPQRQQQHVGNERSHLGRDATIAAVPIAGLAAAHHHHNNQNQGQSLDPNYGRDTVPRDSYYTDSLSHEPSTRNNTRPVSEDLRRDGRTSETAPILVPAAATALAGEEALRHHRQGAVAGVGDGISPSPSGERTLHTNRASTGNRERATHLAPATEAEAARYPKLNFVPAELRLPSILGLVFLCVFMLVALVFSSVHASLSPAGLTRYDGTGTSLYFVYQYLPQLLAAVIILWLHVIQAAMQRILPFVLLSARSSSQKPAKKAKKGKKAAAAAHADPLRTTPTIITNYLLPNLGPFQDGEALLGACNVVFWLALFTVPLAACIYTPLYYLYSSGGQWMWTVTQGVAWALIPLYFLLVLALLYVFARFNLRSTGLRWDPVSVADVMCILRRGNLSLGRGQAGRVESEAATLGYWRSPSQADGLSYGIGVPGAEGEGGAMGEGSRHPVYDEMAGGVPQPQGSNHHTYNNNTNYNGVAAPAQGTGYGHMHAGSVATTTAPGLGGSGHQYGHQHGHSQAQHGAGVVGAGTLAGAGAMAGSREPYPLDNNRQTDRSGEYYQGAQYNDVNTNTNTNATGQYNQHGHHNHQLGYHNHQQGQYPTQAGQQPPQTTQPGSHFSTGTDATNARPAHRDSAIRHDGKPWLPWFLKPSMTLLWAIAALVLLLAFLVVSFVHAAVQTGWLPDVPAGPARLNFAAANFLWSFLPALLGMLLYIAWLPVDAYFRALQPYASMQAGRHPPTKEGGMSGAGGQHLSGAPADKSILLDYGARLPVSVSVRAAANGHLLVAWLSFVSLIAIVIPVLAGGVFLAEYIVGTPDTIYMVASMPGYIALCVFCALYALSWIVVVLGVRGGKRSLPGHGCTRVGDVMDWCVGSEGLAGSEFRGVVSRHDLVGRLASSHTHARGGKGKAAERDVEAEKSMSRKEKKAARKERKLAERDAGLTGGSRRGREHDVEKAGQLGSGGGDNWAFGPHSQGLGGAERVGIYRV